MRRLNPLDVRPARKPVSPLTAARSKRTKAAGVVYANIRSMLTDPAKWALTDERVGPGWVGLPSWWPFWSDVLKMNVRNCVRAGRVVATLEGVEL